MNQAAETTIYEKNDIKITNLRAVFGSKTYAISNITSVETKRIDANGCMPAGLMTIGVLLVFYGIPRLFDAEFNMVIFGAIAFGLGFLIHRSNKPSYAVSLTTASGEIKAYTSESSESISEIIEALNNAIIQKG